MSDTRIQLKLDREELELIAHVIYNYEQNFHDRRAENHALGTKIDNAIEDLEMQEYLHRQPVVDGEVIDNE
tara:strand:- start:126 stop:338 length:213 start_codon:yes stop_codon:yes gene_type:complete